VRLTALVLAAIALVLGLESMARADSLSPSETRRLLRGDAVERVQSLSRGSRRYVGGTAYVLVDASVEGLRRVLANVDAWRAILPSTRSTSRVGETGGDTLVEVTQGSALVHETYTLRVHRSDDEVRFWMDPSRAHDIEDAWGFLRAEPTADGRTLVSYGILIDMGPGLLRDLFEGTVRHMALSVPGRVRAYVERRSARRGADR
jgi:hypothetical protein